MLYVIQLYYSDGRAAGGLELRIMLLSPAVLGLGLSLAITKVQLHTIREVLVEGYTGLGGGWGYIQLL